MTPALSASMLSVDSGHPLEVEQQLLVGRHRVVQPGRRQQTSNYCMHLYISTTYMNIILL